MHADNQRCADARLAISAVGILPRSSYLVFLLLAPRTYVGRQLKFEAVVTIPSRIKEGVKKMEHSRIVGEAVGVDAKTIRRWVTEFCKDGQFVVRERAYLKRQPFSLIDDEDIAEKCRAYIDRRLYHRKVGERRFRIADFRR